MEASAYYESLLRQGYSPEQATQYTLQYYPDFEPSLPEMNPLQNPAAIPTPMPLPSPLPGMPFVPQADLPQPSIGEDFLYLKRLNKAIFRKRK